MTWSRRASIWTRTANLMSPSTPHQLFCPTTTPTPVWTIAVHSQATPTALHSLTHSSRLPLLPPLRSRPPAPSAKCPSSPINPPSSSTISSTVALIWTRMVSQLTSPFTPPQSPLTPHQLLPGLVPVSLLLTLDTILKLTLSSADSIN